MRCKLAYCVNDSNSCCINASVMMILWQAAAQERTDTPNSRTNMLTRGTNMLTRKSWYPVTFLRLALLGWRQLHQQHDAGEFLGYLLPRLPWAAKTIVCSSRVQGARDQLMHYERSCSQILHLDPPEGLRSSPQALVGHWFQQAQLHGLVEECDTLIVQIPRFKVEDGA